MALSVVTVAAGGLPVVETASGLPVSEAANLYGLAVTKVVGKPGLPVTYVAAGGGAGGTAAFNPATLSNVTLSNGNLTATHANTTAGGARAVTPVAAGKFYYEAKLLAGTGSQDGAGFLPAASTYLNLGTEGIQVARVTGNITIVSVASGKTVGAVVVNDIVGLAVDLTARLFWARRNNGLWNGTAGADPATGVGGITVPATTAFAPAVVFVGAGTAINDAWTANFGQTAYANAAPSGFVVWV